MTERPTRLSRNRRDLAALCIAARISRARPAQRVRRRAGGPAGLPDSFYFFYPAVGRDAAAALHGGGAAEAACGSPPSAPEWPRGALRVRELVAHYPRPSAKGFRHQAPRRPLVGAAKLKSIRPDLVRSSAPHATDPGRPSASRGFPGTRGAGRRPRPCRDRPAQSCR